MNRLVTIKPADMDRKSPDERVKTWQWWWNKFGVFAKDNNFAFTALWTRESQRNTGLGEHLHLLIHVPSELQRRFDRRVRGWAKQAGEIDVRRADYKTKRNDRGANENVLTYVTKNCPAAYRFLGATVRPGGPIFGKRYGMSRNITAAARSRDEVRGRLQSDLRLVAIDLPRRAPTAANDDAKPSSCVRAA